MFERSYPRPERFVALRRVLQEPLHLCGDVIGGWDLALSRRHSFQPFEVDPRIGLGRNAGIQLLPLFGDPIDHLTEFDSDTKMASNSIDQGHGTGVIRAGDIECLEPRTQPPVFQSRSMPIR